MLVDVLSVSTGSGTGRSVDLPLSVFGISPNDHAIYLSVRHHLSKRRQGTHKSKERSELKGSTRKLYRQKGTGNARRGDINSPLLRGGARVFGPRPRSYDFKLNRKVASLARRSAYSYKALSERVIVVEDPVFERPSTREFIRLCDVLGVRDRKVLFLLGREDKSFYLSSRNVFGAEVMPVWQSYTYAIVNSEYLVLSESALSWLSDSVDVDLAEVED